MRAGSGARCQQGSPCSTPARQAAHRRGSGCPLRKQQRNGHCHDGRVQRQVGSAHQRQRRQRGPLLQRSCQCCERRQQRQQQRHGAYARCNGARLRAPQLSPTRSSSACAGAAPQLRSRCTDTRAAEHASRTRRSSLWRTGSTETAGRTQPGWLGVLRRLPLATPGTGRAAWASAQPARRWRSARTPCDACTPAPCGTAAAQTRRPPPRRGAPRRPGDVRPRGLDAAPSGAHAR